MRHQTNTELVAELMEFSNSGALMQVFIINALDKMSQMTLDQEAEILESMQGGMINGPAWIACAAELKAKLENR